mgnify:CR=1 FL=1
MGWKCTLWLTRNPIYPRPSDHSLFHVFHLCIISLGRSRSHKQPFPLHNQRQYHRKSGRCNHQDKHIINTTNNSSHQAFPLHNTQRSEELRTHTKNSLLNDVAGLLRKNSRNPASTLIQEDRIGNSQSESDTTVLTDANKRTRLGEQPRRGLDLSHGEPSLGVVPDAKGCEHRIAIQTSATVVWTDGIEKGAAGKSETRPPGTTACSSLAGP